MDELVEQLAVYLHEKTECPMPWDQHSAESKGAWRNLARISIEFSVENIKSLSLLRH